MADILAIEMTGITKTFGAVKALVDADLKVARGTIHGLVGQNGAGKSTIIKILAGIYSPDAGKVVINGEQVTRLTPASVEKLGVHFIHQERLLVPTATVAEAVFVNHEPRFGPFIRSGAMKREAEALIKRYFEIDLPADTLIKDLTTAQQKIVQITRALARKASILVLDEPTAALVKREVNSLFSVLRRLRDDGLAVIFISHYMQEIEELCDVVTVMRNGTDVGVVEPRATSIDEIVAMMINRDVGEMYPRRSHPLGDTLLKADHLSSQGHFSAISFEVRSGEILGITGLLGSGVKELVECLFGLETPDGGTISIEGKVRRYPNPNSAVRSRVALVPEDRRAHGVAIDLSVRDNITLASLDRYMKAGFVSRAREAESVDALIRELSIKTPHRDHPVRNLSGGNQQKVTLAKWLSCQSRVYVLDEPTVAVDVGAKVEIYNLLNRLASEGAAILFMSSDLLEIEGFCDRAITVYRGQLSGEFSGDRLNSDALLAAASGAGSREGAAA
ncbi:sugar ABC transporter ATP-binding protein [Mesorhizobium sp. VK9D]|uniref:sugar ABC transporter ATP-binding protein n=1 Tax=Mesorhizobium australafricanum TaxID=3072311 RepID=UPI002A23DE73|nr:sugar ABC transporter ATP-binding protein [Mesorhizobium sp. VK9D]MDX8452324.1 sugar ABC transporter ATP-binding protein [Mesorhizobium sp. VK9D]